MPISDFLPQITTQLANGCNLVLQAEPGAGKSTVLPLALLEAKWLQGKKIIMLEPRRVAAKSIAHYLAKQLGESVGQRIGYRVKNDAKVSKDTVLEIVTEGILTRQLQGDPDLEGVGLIIFDEFHERSLHADLSLLFALDIQQSIREDLKLLVMSATIDTKLVARHMGGADIIECPGRAFPVKTRYRKSNKDSISQQVLSALRTVLAPENKGDTLVFLPGQGDIMKCLSTAENAFESEPNVVFLPLFGGLSIAQQEKALLPDPNNKRRVVFSTNIAETSLTIEGVTCVIDSGQEKTLIFDPLSGMTRLETIHVSKASAEQRKGRAGRTQEGTCIRLWSEAKQHTLRDYQDEEILSADITGLVLDLIHWGLSDYHEIDWLTAPPQPHFESAKQTLLSLGLLDTPKKISTLGAKALNLGLPPRLAAMLLQAEEGIERNIACELSALLSERDIFYHNNGSDIIERLLAIQDFKKNRNQALQAYPIKRIAVEQLLVNSVSLNKSLARSFGSSVKVARQNTLNDSSLSVLHDCVGRLLLLAYPDRLAKRRSNSCGRYLLANGKGAFLYDDDSLFGSDWLVVADCNAQKKEGRIFSAVSVTYDTILEMLGNNFTEKDYFEFDRKRQKVGGRRITEYGAISIQTLIISEITPEKFQACLHQVFEQEGLGILNWGDRCDEWLSRAQWLGQHIDSFPLLSKSTLLETLDIWLIPYLSGVNSIAGLKKINVLELLVGSLSWENQQRLNQEAPTEYITPSNKSIPINYHSQHGPTISVVLQEMFGEIDSPRIAEGNIPLRFELLSPARRPIQTTSDLGNFWKTSYFDVAKEMRGRYPKHRWPDQPLLEKPGRSIKRK